MTTVVNRKYCKFDVYIGRGSKWGNPYSHRVGSKANYIVDTRKEAIEKYREYIMSNLYLLGDICELKDKVLGCYCKPLSCHGDVLVELVEKFCKDDCDEIT